MGACCLSGKLADSSKKPTGKEEEIGGLQVYVARPESGSVAKSVVFLVDSAFPHLPSDHKGGVTFR